MGNLAQDKPDVYEAISANTAGFMDLLRNTMSDPAAMARAREASRPLAQNEVGISQRQYLVIQRLQGLGFDE